MNRRSYFVTLALSSVVVSILAVALASSRKQPQASPIPADIRKTGDIVDGVLQDRFRRRLEVFGLSRVARPGDGMMRHARSSTQTDVARLKEADALQCDYRIFFYATRDLNADKLVRTSGFAPASLANPLEPLASRDGNLNWAAKNYDFVQTVKQAASADDAKLRQGASLAKPLGDWWLIARPVKAEASCVSCHTTAKPGESLGTLLYTVKALPKSLPQATR